MKKAGSSILMVMTIMAFVMIILSITFQKNILMAAFTQNLVKQSYHDSITVSMCKAGAFLAATTFTHQNDRKGMRPILQKIAWDPSAHLSIQLSLLPDHNGSVHVVSELFEKDQLVCKHSCMVEIGADSCRISRFQ